MQPLFLSISLFAKKVESKNKKMTKIKQLYLKQNRSIWQGSHTHTCLVSCWHGYCWVKLDSLGIIGVYKYLDNCSRYCIRECPDEHVIGWFLVLHVKQSRGEQYYPLKGGINGCYIAHNGDAHGGDIYREGCIMYQEMPAWSSTGLQHGEITSRKTRNPFFFLSFFLSSFLICVSLI